MGLFGRKPAAAPVDDPLAALSGLTVVAAAYADDTLTLAFQGGGGDALIEAYGKLTVDPGRNPLAPGEPSFDAAVKALSGRKVKRAAARRGEALVLEFDGGAAVVASLKAGEYPGTSAVYLKGPGKSYVNFHEDGFTRLTL